jgi:hypothetical protein
MKKLILSKFSNDCNISFRNIVCTSYSVHFGLQDSELGSCNNKPAAIFFMPSMPFKVVGYFAQHGWYLCAL